MNIIRDASTVTVDEINNALVIGFARLDHHGTPEEYVLLQRSLDPDEDEPGVKGVYVERDDQRFSGYGGIVRFVLRRDQVLMELDTLIGGVLGYPEVWREVMLCFTVGDTAFAELRRGLGRLFAGCECFSDRSPDAEASPA